MLEASAGSPVRVRGAKSSVADSIGSQSTQGYDNANQTKYAREAVKWGADYLMTAHIAKDTFVAQVGSPLIDGEHHEPRRAQLAVPHVQPGVQI